MKVEFVEFNNEHKKKLNTWQDIETSHGENGINEFVVASGTKLGDYIEYFSRETNITSKVAIDNGEIVGFVCYVINEDASAHVEIMGTNPNCRGKGYARKILEKLKEDLNKNWGVKKITLAVNKRNKQGIKSFSKFAKGNSEHSSENYIGLEL